MATVNTVTIYDQPVGVGAARLRCDATLVTNPEAGQVASISLAFLVQVAAGPPAQLVEVTREDWLAIRAMRALP